MTGALLAAILPAEMRELQLKPLFIFQIDVAKPSVIGRTPSIDRRGGGIAGGTFEGERLRGKILSCGGVLRDELREMRLPLQPDCYRRRPR
jgi:Protein of unknown function (DUF3237)